MRLRRKPKKPVRIIRQEQVIKLYDSDYLDLLEGIDLGSATFHHDRNSYDSCSTYVSSYRSETDEEFTKRMARYEKNLAAYNKWERDNKEAIEKEKKKRKKKAAKTARKDLEKERERLKKAQATIEKNLAELESL
jgi:hypothetical protein